MKKSVRSNSKDVSAPLETAIRAFSQLPEKERGAIDRRIRKMKYVTSGGELWANQDLMLERGRFVMIMRSKGQPICFRTVTARSAARWILREIVPSELQSSFKIV
jgi:hypothetical protein